MTPAQWMIACGIAVTLLWLYRRFRRWEKTPSPMHEKCSKIDDELDAAEERDRVVAARAHGERRHTA